MELSDPSQRDVVAGLNPRDDEADERVELRLKLDSKF